MRMFFNISLQGNCFQQDDTIMLISEFLGLEHREFLYVAFMSDYNSPYRNFPEKDRSMEIISDIFGAGQFNNTEDIKIKKAIEKYKKLQRDPLRERLAIIDEKFYELNVFLKKTKIDGDNAAEVTKLISDNNKLIKERQQLINIIEQRGLEHIRGSDDKSWIEQQLERKENFSNK